VTILPRSFVIPTGVARVGDDRGDHQLFADLAAGRPEALGALYDRHAASLFRHGLALTRRSPDAEDLVQAVFVKLATTGAGLAGVNSPASYLHRMLHTTWLDGHRRRVAGAASPASAPSSKRTKRHAGRRPPAVDWTSRSIWRALSMTCRLPSAKWSCCI